MGLDISFNKERAKQAGMLFGSNLNGDADQIKEEESALHPDMGYVAWLKEETQCIQLPIGYKEDDFTRGYDEFDGNMSVRANRWGDFYAPLTKFLKENDIEWSEY